MLYNVNKPDVNSPERSLTRGRLITLEGIDGTGKSTQIASLAAKLREAGSEVLELREPGGTAIGESIRKILLDSRNTGMCQESELLLFTAARAQLVREVILPALLAGTWVICDRFLDSSLAYQGYGRGLDLATIDSINSFAVDGCRPDLTILLDLPVAAAVARLSTRQGKADRLDVESISFMQRVREGYLAAAAREPKRFMIVDAGQPEEQLAQEIISKIWEGTGT
jgi:dTMP kinase